MSARSSRLIGLVAVASAVFCGCDAVDGFVPGSKRQDAEAAERERTARQKEDSASALADVRSALRQHIEASRKLLEATLEECRGKAAETKMDRAVFASRIRELTSATAEGKSPSRAEVLSALLDDDRMNDLAAKYMERNFRLVKLEFAEKMDALSKSAKDRAAALRQSQSDYAQSVSEARADTGREQSAARKSESEMRKTIAELTRRESELQRALSMSSAVSAVRRQREVELRDLSNRLRQLQREYDSVRANKGVADAAAAASRRQDDAIDRAQRRKEQADKQIASRFAELESPSRIVSAYESENVQALESRIASAERELDERIARIGAGVAYLRATAEGVDKLGESGLRDARADVDARLSDLNADK